MVIKIGVLELQGNFALHHHILSKLKLKSIPVKNVEDLKKVKGLIIPGGESTTISLLIDSYNLRESLICFAKKNPIMGTCAGLIMMAKKVSDKRVHPLELLDIEIDRNAYGRQIMSKTEYIYFNLGIKKKIKLETTFIRAPKIKKINKKIKVIGNYNGNPIAVLSGHFLGLSFHPELNNIILFHQILFDPKSDVYFKKIDQKYAA